MTLAFLRASLKTWEYKAGYRKQRHTRARATLDSARDGDRHPRQKLVNNRDRWARLLETARRKVQERHREIVSKIKENQEAARKTTGVGYYDGVPVANVAIPYLKWARAHGWQGRLVSGWRDPKYSQQLCYRMCGAPSCPGKCAGLNSNHVGATSNKFALDVSDYQRFGQLMRSCPYSPRIFNGLGARDPVHFSPSGN